MKKIKNRTHERRVFKAEITHSMFNKNDHRKHYANGYIDNYHRGKMINISTGGMVFISDIPCWKNEHIFVNHVGKTYGLSNSDITDPLAGTVVWCEKTLMDNQPLFKTGVKFFLQEQDTEKNFASVLGPIWLS